ncbi:hypothetical protein SETIT_9G309400v2 [Setaria italica]|uniref:Uncharacterized protein n=1 Tax=Setaria italica TaxID=4555 RepID=A0A368SMN9_SETIT|nr:hypothetical protein SETIT_9G309400v2 [Setaria italica]
MASDPLVGATDLSRRHPIHELRLLEGLARLPCIYSLIVNEFPTSLKPSHNANHQIMQSLRYSNQYRCHMASCSTIVHTSMQMTLLYLIVLNYCSKDKREGGSNFQKIFMCPFLCKWFS